jgi:hypothetical protein
MDIAAFSAFCSNNPSLRTNFVGRGKAGKGKGSKRGQEGKGKGGGGYDDDRKRGRGSGGKGKGDQGQDGWGKGRQQPPTSAKGESQKLAAWNERGKVTKKKEATSVDKDNAAKDKQATTAAIHEGAHWRYGPFPGSSQSGRRNKGKVKLGSKYLKKLTTLDGKKFEKHGPIYSFSLEVLANAFSFLNTIERWKLRPVSTVFALTFQLDPAWTSATVEPSSGFQGPLIQRDHLPMQLDVLHKHRDVLETLNIRGFDGLQGALLQNFTSLKRLYVISSQRCSGLSFVPKSVEKMRLEFCTMSTPDKELEALKESHPAAEIELVKCADSSASGKGQPFCINIRMIAGLQYKDAE